MTNSGLTKTECAALRGLAIMGIVLHNYCHWLPRIVRENEYLFSRANAEGILHAVGHPDEQLIIHLFSFFGHYGVPVFLFLSGYGLTLKYERNATESLSAAGRATFVWRHFVKLFRMMIVGFAAFTMVDAITPGRHHYAASDVLAQLLMVGNVLPNPDKIIWPGPFWFFGLMLQLYIIYILLLHRRHWGWTVGLMVVCEVLQLLCDPTGDTLNRLRYNFIGGMLPFGLGLLAARHDGWLRQSAGVNAMLLVVSVVLVWFGSQLNMFTWTLVPVLIIVSNVALIRLLPRSVVDVLAWLGGISAILFVCHPIMRKIFIPLSRHGDVYAGLLLYIVAAICTAWVCKRLMDRKDAEHK